MAAPEHRFEIQSILFTEDQGALITYVEIPTDVRVNGQLVKTHQLSLSGDHRDYRSDVIDLHDAITDVLRNALEDFESSEPYVPPEPESDSEDDDEMGMGF